jgi:WD40 repeat protein
MSKGWQGVYRAALGSLAGSIAGLALLGAAPATALAKSVVHAASATFTRGQTLYTYKGLPGGIYTVDWAPDGTRIVTAGSDLSGNNIATVWDDLTGNNSWFLRSLQKHGCVSLHGTDR